MERTHVISRVMQSIGYNPEKRTLEIELLTGEVFEYENISGMQHELVASVHGDGYFEQFIRGRHPARQLR